MGPVEHQHDVFQNLGDMTGRRPPPPPPVGFLVQAIYFSAVLSKVICIYPRSYATQLW